MKCFASFMLETRSSDSETAQLKDFILGSFPLCRVEIAKECSTNGYYDSVNKVVVVPWSATATNGGFAPVDITLTDNLCGYGSISKTFTGVAPNTTVTWDGTGTGYQDCHVPAADAPKGIKNGVKGVALDTSTGAPVTVARAETCTIVEGDEYCYDSCGFNTNPSLAVSKDCKVVLE